MRMNCSRRSRNSVVGVLAMFLALWAGGAAAGEAKPKSPVWTDAGDPTLPPDFKYQGEFVGEIAGGGKLGCQIISLSGGAFQAVVLPGGLPGDGWDGKSKILMDGKLEGEKVWFAPPADPAKKKYMAKAAAEFSATSKNPPDGYKPYTAEGSGDAIKGKTDDGKSFELKKIERKSPTMGAKPPEGATVLFDGSNKDKWKDGRVDEKTKLLNTDGHDIVSKDKFSNYTMHLEFMEPFRPDERSQGRGNSGFYQIDMYEMQILDSFGLEGKDNECGGIYTKKAPNVNMCLPPLTWQTYDVEFTNAVADADGKVTKKPLFTARLNGVLIHENYEIPGKTGGARKDPEGTPGPIRLQGHGNPLQFRNIWIVEKK